MSFKINKKLYCPLCKRTRVAKFWAMPGYKLARCSSCGMVWDPFPPVNAFSRYDRNYFINENPKGGYANYFEGMKINKKTFYQRLLRIEKRIGGKGRLLDVGCALGDCLSEAKILGWTDVVGLEVSSFAFQFAKRRGLKVKLGTLSKTFFKPNTFDAVLYQDVVEHIKDPLNELIKVKKVLKPRGLVFLVTPDIEGLWSKLLGRFWYHYKPGEHLNYFSQKTIKSVLKKSGFVNIKTQETFHVLSVEYVLNRLRFYSPSFFGFLIKLAKKIGISNLAFRGYIGEFEAWAQKPD